MACTCQVMIHDRAQLLEAAADGSIVTECALKFRPPPRPRLKRHIFIHDCLQAFHALLCVQWPHEAEKWLRLRCKRLVRGVKLILG